MLHHLEIFTLHSKWVAASEKEVRQNFDIENDSKKMNTPQRTAGYTAPCCF